VAVHIRLRRTGTTRKPAYRVVVADSRAARDGKFIEVLGHYNPLTKPPTIKIQVERAQEWWNSAEYAEAKALRQATASTQMIVVEGVE